MIGQKLKTFNFVKLIGKGNWSQVYLAIDERNEAYVAIKVTPKKLIQQTKKLEQLIKTQIKVLKSCKNQNVIQYIDSFQSAQFVFIVTQYCNEGDLQKHLEQKRRLTEDEAIIFLKQILNGFKGLHEVNAMHRDFKLANVLLNNSICKIADLGFAKVLQKNSVTSTVLGTSLTMAPEVLDEQQYGRQADIWSIGVVFYQMLFGKYPFTGINDLDILKKIKKSRPDYSSVAINSQVKDFLDKCLTVDPKKRISWIQLYNHTLLNENSRILYSGALASKISFNQNKDFYKDKKFDQFKHPYLESNDSNDYNIGDNADNVPIRQSINMEKMLKQTNKRQQIEKQIIEYEKLYLNHRNNIIFVAKFILPYIYNLIELKANHSISMFILHKDAYLNLYQFNKYLQNRTNFLQLKFWNQFIASSIYKHLSIQIQSDLQFFETQVIYFKEDIDICSSEIRQQKKSMNSKANKNFRQLVKSTLQQYWFLLADGLNTLKGDKKQHLIRVLNALLYMRKAKKIIAEQFDKIMSLINFQKAQDEIKKQLMQAYK